MKKGKMEVRVINSRLVVVLVAMLVIVMTSGVAFGRDCMGCHSGKGKNILPVRGKKCPVEYIQKDHKVKADDNASLLGLAQLTGVTYYVPDDFTTIQEAIDAAADGDEIIVRDGTYDENIRFWGKAITVRSENGPATTIIQGVEGQTPGPGPAAVVTFWNGEGADSVLNGFAITNGINGGFGGGIACYAQPTISNCIINGNHGYWGGGIFLWGMNYYSPTITNCTITNNTCGDSGAGIYASSCSPIITNCTISSNSATSSGGAIRCYSSPTVVNSVLWGNSPDEISGGGPIVITYSDIEGGWAGTGNIDTDPLFVSGGDYHLTGGSPCIDVGTDDTVTYPTLPTDDIDSNIRPIGDGYDMGSDEYAAKISGFVTDENYNGIAGAQVELFLSDVQVGVTSTGSKGHYEFEGLDDAVYEVVAESGGGSSSRQGKVEQAYPWSEEEFINLIISP
jgi:parallel beta-helix repeat protein